MRTTVHRATNIRMDSRYPQNANSVTLEIVRGNREPVFITINNLPKEATDKLDALADSNTRHHTD